MARATLRTPSGEKELALTECDVGLARAVVRWSRTEEPEFEYRAIVHHDRELVPQRLVPGKLAAYQLEWPCERNCSGSEYQVSIPTDSRCLPEFAESTSRTFALPAAHEGGCSGEAWMGFVEAGWCQRQVDGAEVHRFDRWGALGNIDHGLLGVDGQKVVASLNGISVRITASEQVDRIRVQARRLWEEESENSESCRDGGRAVVRAQRREGWKVVIRECSDPGGIGQLIQTAMAIEQNNDASSNEDSGP